MPLNYFHKGHHAILKLLKDGATIEKAKPEPRPFMTLDGEKVGVTFEFDVVQLVEANLVEWQGTCLVLKGTG